MTKSLEKIKTKSKILLELREHINSVEEASRQVLSALKSQENILSKELIEDFKKEGMDPINNEYISIENGTK